MNKEKSQAEIEIEALADVFGIATTSFQDFYKATKNNAKGINSTAASSGNYSTAASSGNYSTAASSGNYSKAASSGENSTAASSGYNSTAASSGYNSKAASSGYNSKAASSGNYSKAASSGENSTAASSGEGSGCTAIGYRAAVKGDLGNLLMASEYIVKDGKFIPVGGKADLVDGKILKPNCYYIVEKGEWVQVDFTDGVFTYVISNKNSVKKVKTESGKVLFIVTDNNGNYAHGDTIKAAREDLQFKTSERNPDSWRNLPLDTIKTAMEWAGVYRDCTGACMSGIKHFMEKKGKLKKSYTLAEIIEETKGAYQHEKFLEIVRG